MSDPKAILDRVHKALLKELKADPEPSSDLARFVVSATGASPKSGRVLFSGDSYLSYVFEGGGSAPGPRESIPDKLDPYEVCTRLITEGYGQPDSPRRITFRYDKVKDKWRGGYAVESFQAYKAQVAKRAELDAQMTEALRSVWKKGMKKVDLVYGWVGKQRENGPWLVVARPQNQFEHIKAPSPFPAIWEEYVAHYHDFGHQNVYWGSFSLEGPKASLQELKGIDIDYGI
ncbi:MAG: hypothetical protein AB7K71_07150 [Polyangiaceae bacterium]